MASVLQKTTPRPPRLNPYDVVIKDLFEKDCPTLLKQLTRGATIVAVLTPEIPLIRKNVADLVFRLADGSILHVEFQATNEGLMCFREGIYGLGLASKYQCDVRQAVLYAGRAPMRMKNHLKLHGIEVKFDLIDLRDLDVDVLLSSGNPADYPLALLARGGAERLREIVQRAAKLKPERRARVLTQLAVLAGLRGRSEEVKMEVKNMGLSHMIKTNVFFRDAYESGLAKGEAKGEARGKAEGKADLLLNMLTHKFGRVPTWARERVTEAREATLNRWSERIFTAETIEEAIGKRR